MRITLSEEDAQRLGVPREMNFREDRIMGSELIALEEQVGWDVERLDQALIGEPVTNAIGQPVWVLDDKDKPVLDDKGKPRQQRAMKVRTLMVLAWMCARRANPAIAWDGFDINVLATEFVPEPEGKAPSPTGTTTGKRPSRRSSASSRGSSAKS